MVAIAIAGGTGNIGQTIAEVLKENPEHKVIVLSRKAPEVQDEAAPVIVVNYDDVDELTRVLENDNIHTVISTIPVMGPESGGPEINLVRAADKSGPTKRFISSDWSIPFPKMGEPSPQHAARAATIAELRETGLEWTTVHNGYLTDYFGVPHIKSHMRLIAINVDMANKAASLPGTGDDVVSFTYSFDVAKFVELAIGLPRWEEELFCYGDHCTFNEVVRMAEQATASKFSVAYDSKEKLKQGHITELPSHPLAYSYFPKPVLQSVFATFGLYVIQGLFKMPEERSLNRLFPDVKTKKVSEVINAWKGK
ncbi:hypothetical protein QBC33DRAFT_550029 [Phialemonium atrogriseum]|uniref:NAD(P)-binding domain-containing protein n=1 Tax=Phialemonium atrogriseum TaxID=1093897 RepID=A0AAJ0BRZ2_9PEZI|nr:uncharacterized protein QBC33DRAFT_550029 [Phialemonium atrogriseum]KAK1763389.1 hypothetical protein QBC33DRAFT_550029 [Phialemonium atrogriseum]